MVEMVRSGQVVSFMLECCNYETPVNNFENTLSWPSFHC